MLLPGGRAFIIGKTGVGYLLDARNLGGIGHQIHAQDLQQDSYGGLAYANGLIYIPFRAGGIVALHLNPSSTSIAWRRPSFRSGPPIVAGPAVWAIDLGRHRLYALDRTTGRLRFQTPIPEPAQFSTPTAANGRIYAAAGERVLSYGVR
jgi:hypothetical protein